MSLCGMIQSREWTPGKWNSGVGLLWTFHIHPWRDRNPHRRLQDKSPVGAWVPAHRTRLLGLPGLALGCRKESILSSTDWPCPRLPGQQRSMRNLFILALLGAIVWFGYGQYKSKLSMKAPIANATSERPASPTFTCDGRTHCSHMRSCAEATYFIKHCPNTKMDGDNDGVPCERQWCN